MGADYSTGKVSLVKLDISNYEKLMPSPRPDPRLGVVDVHRDKDTR